MNSSFTVKFNPYLSSLWLWKDFIAYDHICAITRLPLNTTKFLTFGNVYIIAAVRLIVLNCTTAIVELKTSSVNKHQKLHRSCSRQFCHVSDCWTVIRMGHVLDHDTFNQILCFGQCSVQCHKYALCRGVHVIHRRATDRQA